MLSQFRLPSLHSRVDDHLHPMTLNNSIEFQPSRSDDNRIHAPNPMERISAKRMRCPNCDLPAIAPMVSTYLANVSSKTTGSAALAALNGAAASMGCWFEQSVFEGSN
jgi:hypothetical protein